MLRIKTWTRYFTKTEIWLWSASSALIVLSFCAFDRENYLTLTGAVTVLFYFILDHFETANILPSTLSVTTSFLAVYLTFRKSPYFALAYASNDIVLIVLWVMASMADARYISVAVCFAAFFVNDIYGYISWRKRKLRQARGC